MSRRVISQTMRQALEKSGILGNRMCPNCMSGEVLSAPEIVQHVPGVRGLRAWRDCRKCFLVMQATYTGGRLDLAYHFAGYYLLDKEIADILFGLRDRTGVCYKDLHIGVSELVRHYKTRAATIAAIEWLCKESQESDTPFLESLYGFCRFMAKLDKSTDKEEQ